MNAAHQTDAKIGHWHSICCHCDLLEIADERDTEWIKAQRSYGINVSVWETQREALLEIRAGTLSATSLAEIDGMLTDLGEV